jgi:predicted nucleotidyltransferase
VTAEADGTIERIVARVKPELEALPEAVGAILHGSHAQGTAREDSDVDFVCVTSDGMFCKEIRLIEGREVEIQKFPVEQIRFDLVKLHKPFTVRAFSNCRVLFDRDGTVAELCETARKKWERGAPPPSQVEVLLGKSYLRHHLEDLKRLGEDPVRNRVPMEGLLAEAFFWTVRAHLRARGRWLTKISHALEVIREEDPEFWEMAEEYSGTAAVKEKAALMERMVERAMEPVGELVVEYETPRIPADVIMARGDTTGG